MEEKNWNVRQDVTTWVQKELKERCGEDQINIDTHLKDDLGLDSLDLVEILMKAERDFVYSEGLSPNKDPQTAGELIDYIVQHL